jgi:signal transduction histidine kinase
VLHNVGNALNSVNVSATIALEHIRRSRVPYLAKVAELLNEHAAHLPAFLTEDPKGRKLPEYLAGFAHALAEEHVALKRELEDLRKNVDHIIEVVAMQQNYARLGGMTESVALADVIEDAIRMNNAALKRHEITLQRDYRAQPVISTDRHKVLQILVNLIHNAKYACDASGSSNKTITIRMEQEGPHVRISVSDNGIGIRPENLTRIFSHGFTTRTGGHGFGLHSGALAAKELGGSLVAGSDGPYHGATFVLELPLFGEKTGSAAPFAKRSAAAATIDSGDST